MMKIVKYRDYTRPHAERTGVVISESEDVYKGVRKTRYVIQPDAVSTVDGYALTVIRYREVLDEGQAQSALELEDIIELIEV